MADTTHLVIDGNPGSYQIGIDDWDGYIACVEVVDCSHGGSIASITVSAVGDSQAVAAFSELTPGDVDALIAVLTTIRATISPEAE